MKLAIDISQIVYEGSGVGRFTEGLVRTICDYDKNNEWIFFFSSLRKKLDPRTEAAILKSGHRLIKKKLPPTLLSYLWNKLHTFSIDRYIGKVDWLITSDWTEPPSNNKKATIVHDLVFMKYPDTVADQIKKAQELRLLWIKKESQVIFADSESTKVDISEMYKVDDSRIVVNYPGIQQSRISNIENRISDRRPFILTVGKLEPRKNIERLVEAFENLERDDIDLYIVGMNGWGDVKVEQRPNIKLLGYVSEEKLSELYKSCLFFVLPSLYEGFGYPILEAMSNGAPVATSKSSSMKEIAKDSAILFDPLSVEDIKNTLQKILDSASLRKELSKKGKITAAQFTWKKYYDTMIKVLSSKF